jgi:hypothetical protein
MLNDAPSTQIGTVELLTVRIYPLDPETADHPLSTSVVVESGTYPVYRQVDAYYWIMTGHVNARGATKIGDGMFTLAEWDAPSGPEVKFPSRRYGPEQFADFLAESVCTEGHPDQRLRFALTKAGTWK